MGFGVEAHTAQLLHRAQAGNIGRKYGFSRQTLDAFGLDGDVAVAPTEDGAVELGVTGGDLGLLMGPKGQTLQAVQELSRSVLQRSKPGETLPDALGGNLEPGSVTFPLARDHVTLARASEAEGARACGGVRGGLVPPAGGGCR